MRIATWNTKWAGKTHGPTIAEDLVATKADVIVGTEVLVDLLPSYEHVVDAGTDWGYELPDGRRRKVAMWSARPWTDVTRFDDPTAPGGVPSYASADPALGPVRQVGVCTPGRDANVTGGRRVRVCWADHLAFLGALPSQTRVQPLPVVVVGDFNQRIPRGSQPLHVFDALTDAVTGLEVPTAGETAHGQLIDHVAHSPELSSSVTDIICPSRDGVTLSDHHGVVVDFQQRAR